MDLKTLRLASIDLNAALLDRFVLYQRSLLGHLARSTHGEWSGRLAFAHGHAFAEAGLDLVTLNRVNAVVSEFCGKRSTLSRVRERLHGAVAAEAAGAGDVKVKARALIEKATAELPRLEDLSDMEARYGAGAVALLKEREDELMGLHRELARAEGGEGHLHLRLPV